MLNFADPHAKPARRGSRRKAATADANKLLDVDRPAHAWYRFVLSYPPHLVRQYLDEFDLGPESVVLDPFCGTGTTVVECKKRGVASIGVEANRMAFFACASKVDWTPDPQKLREDAEKIAAAAVKVLAADGLGDDVPFMHPVEEPVKHGLRTLPPEVDKLLLARSISPLPLHKTLILLEQIDRHGDPTLQGHERLALAKALVADIGNLHFGPEVGVGPPKPDAAVLAPWLAGIAAMATDLAGLRRLPSARVDLHHADSRHLLRFMEPASVDAVITSPPYPNEKDYTRTTRLESVLLGLLRDKADLRSMKAKLIRSNTRNVYKGDDDEQWVENHPKILAIADEIERRRIELGKTSGFERMYARVTRHYFGGMKRHLSDLRTILRPGAQLAYVVGDQASYLRVMIRTGELLAEIATSLGYEHVRTDLFRTRLATATKAQLREEVVILSWPGP